MVVYQMGLRDAKGVREWRSMWLWGTLSVHNTNQVLFNTTHIGNTVSLTDYPVNPSLGY
jgi:hypothetical protein